MKSAVESISATRVKISIDVDFNDLEPHVKRAYQSISERVVIPGFRKGKVPRAMIDQRVGRGAVLDEAINNALPEFYTQAARENDVLVVGRPTVDIKELKDNELVKFEYQLHQNAMQEAKQKNFTALSNQYGRNLDQADSVATEAAVALGGQQALDYLKSSGLAINPIVFNMLYKAGQMMKSDRFPVGGVSMNSSDNALALRTEIKNLYADPKFYQDFKEGNKLAQDRINSLYAKLERLENPQNRY